MNTTLRSPRIREDAFYGLAGKIVRLIEPHSESDPTGLLLQFLAAAGNVVGRNVYYPAEADRHHANLFLVLVGESAKGRKGTSWGHVARVFESADPTWRKERIFSGLSSGEGLMFALKDDEEPHNKLFIGNADKRMLVLESEFASVLRTMEREGNTLSAVLRNAWDTGNLRSLTKNAPIKASGVHISIVGHITRLELLKYLRETETANGFGNRFLWASVRRSKLLPFGGQVPESELEEYIAELRAAISFGRQARKMCMSVQAAQLWCEVYGNLSDDAETLTAAMTSRAESQVCRIATVYALLDKAERIEIQHLQAALAVWEFCEASCKYIFGRSVGNPTADRILIGLQQRSVGMTRTEIRDLFNRNKMKSEIDDALALLKRSGAAACTTSPSDGRDVEIWSALGTTETTNQPEGARARSSMSCISSQERGQHE